MLKNCWDCIAGSINRESGGNDRYEMNLNGSAQSLGKMYRIAKDLSPRDSVSVTITVGDINFFEFNIRLLTTNLQTALQLQVKNNGQEDKITVNGEINDFPGSHMVGKNTFPITIDVHEDNYVDLKIDTSSLLTVPMKLEYNIQDIRFLSVDGVNKVNSLTFEFDKEW